MQQMVIASRLDDGLVVFLAEDGRWVECIADGAVATGEASGEALLEKGLRDVPACRVIDPYLIEITTTGGERRPVEYREAIRALGPSVAVEAG